LGLLIEPSPNAKELSDHCIGINPEGLSHSPDFRLVACRGLELDPITGHDFGVLA
jgi:hypothetical protein